MSDEIVMCDKVPGERAVARYRWSWGETGACSFKGQQLLRQQAKNLKQTVDFMPLAQPPAPLARDERTRLIAEKISAESERDETAARNSKLYQQNTDLMAEVKLLRTRDEEAQAQLKDLKQDLAEASEELTRTAVQNGKLVDELNKANLLLEAGPGEEEAELKSLREQVERLEGSEASLRESLNHASGLVGELKSRNIASLEALLAYEQDPGNRSIIEADIRKLKFEDPGDL